MLGTSRLFSIGAASLSRIATALRGCMACPCAGLTHGDSSLTGSGCTKCGPLYIDNGLVQVKHARSTTARQRGRMGPGREQRKPLLECASRIVPYIRYQGAKYSRCTTVVEQAAPMLAHTLAQLMQNMRVHTSMDEPRRIGVRTHRNH